MLKGKEVSCWPSPARIQPTGVAGSGEGEDREKGWGPGNVFKSSYLEALDKTGWDSTQLYMVETAVCCLLCVWGVGSEDV